MAFLEVRLALPIGTIKATVLIETLTGRVRDGRDPARAARTASSGLNCGRWDYIFSYLKTFRRHPRSGAARSRHRSTWACPSSRPIPNC
jgi:malate synthase